MIKFLLLVFLFSSSFSQEYQKMKKSHGFDDDICKYTYSSITYVKPCEEGKFCKSFGDLSKCIELETKVQGKTLGDPCSSTYECENGLTCQTVCTKTCGTGFEVYKTSSGYGCRDINKVGLLYEADKTGINTYNDMLIYITSTPTPLLYPHSPGFYQIPGKITFFSKEDSNKILWAIEKIEPAYIGSLPDGTFVMDESACKSGVALYFYPNGKLVDPTNGLNKMYLKCVTLNEVNTDNKFLKYDGDNIYNYRGTFPTQDLYIQDSSLSPNIGPYSMIKQEIFSKYVEAFSESKQKECEKNKNIEQYTCEDNEARKWYYFYRNPEEYVLYYDEEEKDNDIMNYLLQNEYKTFISGCFLSMKILTSIAMFLFL
jgi:hypothetical protein